MKLSDFKGEEALDVLADIIEPLTYVLADEEIQEMRKKAQEAKQPLPYIKYVTPALRNHKPEIIQILARLERKTVDEYKETMNLLTLPMQVLDLISDPEIQSLFQSQSQIPVTPLASSGSVLENTEATEG